MHIYTSDGEGTVEQMQYETLTRKQSTTLKCDGNIRKNKETETIMYLSCGHDR